MPQAPPGPGPGGAKGKGKKGKGGKPQSNPTGRSDPPDSGQGSYEASKEIRIAVIELFAGLRTTHVAAKRIRNLSVVLAHAAEKCPFANSLARKNNIIETLFLDVAKLDATWAKDFVQKAVAKGACAILIIAGFPCKGLSRQNGTNKPNLDHPESASLRAHPPNRKSNQEGGPGPASNPQDRRKRCDGQQT